MWFDSTEATPEYYKQKSEDEYDYYDDEDVFSDPERLIGIKRLLFKVLKEQNDKINVNSMTEKMDIGYNYDDQVEGLNYYDVLFT